jgi:urease accessory protein UreE
VKDKSNQDQVILEMLSLSKQRLILAQNEQWQALFQLDKRWHIFLENTIKEWGDKLEDSFYQVQLDNESVIKCIEKAQFKENSKHYSIAKNISKIKSYLK